MIKMETCIHCNSGKQSTYCDTCERYLGGVAPITLSYGFGSELDGAVYDFCSMKCVKKFVDGEINKNKPKDNRFIFGKTQKEKK
jgi:hypothetical protein